MMTHVTRFEVLKLYKNCLVYINSLKYSDKIYLKQRLREEFRRDTSHDKLEYYYNKGLEFLKRDRLV